MRADPNLYPSVNNAMQLSKTALQTAVDQLSSGKRVAVPSDDPLAFAQNLRSLDNSASVDRYTQNAEVVSGQAQAADAALSSVVGSLTQAVSLGTQAGNSGLTTGQRATLATEVQGLVQQVLAAANQQSNGVALFGGAASVPTAFVPNPSSPGTFLYQGSNTPATASIGSNVQVMTALPGNQIFDSPGASVLGSLQQLATAIPAGVAATLSAAVAQVSAAISHIGEVRAQYSNTVGAVNQQNSFLSQETLTLTSQQQSLVGVDIATAATNLTQAQLGNSAVLAMAAKILPESLLNYLH